MSIFKHTGNLKEIYGDRSTIVLVITGNKYMGFISNLLKLMRVRITESFTRVFLGTMIHKHFCLKSPLTLKHLEAIQRALSYVHHIYQYLM